MESPFAAALQEISSPVAVKDIASDTDGPSAPVVFNEPRSDAFHAVHSIFSMDSPDVSTKLPFKLPTKVKKRGRPKKSKYVSSKRAKNEDSTESYRSKVSTERWAGSCCVARGIASLCVHVERP